MYLIHVDTSSTIAHFGIPKCAMVLDVSNLHVSSTLHFLGFHKVFGIPKCAMVLHVSNLHVSSTLHFLGFQNVFGTPKCAMVLDVSTCIKYIALFGIPKSFWDPKMCNGTWCIYMYQVHWTFWNSRKFLGSQNVQWYLMYPRYGSTNSLMMTPSSRNMSLYAQFDYNK